MYAQQMTLFNNVQQLGKIINVAHVPQLLTTAEESKV